MGCPSDTMPTDESSGASSAGQACTFGPPRRVARDRSPNTRSLVSSRRIRPLYTSLVYCLVANVLCIRLSYTFFCTPLVISPHTFRSRHIWHLHLTAYVLYTRYTLYLATLRCCRIRPVYTFLVYYIFAYVLCLRLSCTFSDSAPEACAIRLDSAMG